MTNDNITLFLFDGEKTIRVIDRDGSPWFVGKDIATALGYQNTAAAITKHCKHAEAIGDRGVRDSRTPHNIDPQTKIVPESDVFRLIFGSGLASAKQFEEWVMEKVLPSIRKTGGYQIPPQGQDLERPDELKLKIVNSGTRIFGVRAGAQLWVKEGLTWVPAMAAALSQADIFDTDQPPGSVQVIVRQGTNGGHH